MIETIRSGFGLLEGPVYDPQRGLLFTDAEAGGVHCLGADGSLETVVKHRRGIGGIVLHENGGLVVSGRNVAYKASLDAQTVVLLDNAPNEGVVGFNDITTDSVGRIYAGSLAYRPTVKTDRPKPGCLHVIELDGTTRELASGIETTNGMGFSPEGGRLYHADTLRRAVYVYDVCDRGDVSNKRIFVSLDEGMPDGLAVAMDGAVWFAAVHAGLVLVFDSEGQERRRYRFPVPVITSLCFAGEDLCDVYVVSGSEGSGHGQAGTIFRMRSDVPGVVVSPARVQVPDGTER